MSTKLSSSLQFKIFGSIFLALVLLTIHYFLQSTELERQLANDIETAQSDWTRGQKLKWALTKQFTINLTDQKFTAKNAMTPNLCEGNHGMRFGFTAFETMIAGTNPRVDLIIGCQDLLALPDYNVEVDLKKFVDLVAEKQSKVGPVQFTSHLLYIDEEWPVDWMLSEIEILGPNGFSINQYEIQDALKQVFSTTIRK